MTPIFVPHWVAEKMRQKYGYLPEGVKDAYWHELNQESQERINEKLRLIRSWRLVSETKVMYQNRRQARDA